MALYLSLHKSGELKNRAAIFSKHLSNCELCPHKCKVNRLNGELGICGAKAAVRIHSYQLHFGEEPAISGNNGSGTIFFSYCSGRCIYCQNWRFSQAGEGRDLYEKELSRLMLDLQNMGAHNINLVTPAHFLPQIIQAVCMAAESGLNIPIVYNTSGYERVEILKLLEGIVDIYLPDLRYFNDDFGLKFSGFPEYGRINREAIKEMYRQVGNLEIDNGIAKKGLLIRHLILPKNISDIDKVLQFIAAEISQDSFVSLMSQYHPFYLSLIHISEPTRPY